MLQAVKWRVFEALLVLAPGVLRGWWSLRVRLAAAASKPDAMPPRASGRPCVLLVGDDFPEPDCDAGSRAISAFAGLLREAGFDVVFWAASIAPSSPGRQALVELGIGVASQNQTGPLLRWLRSRGTTLKPVAAVLSRPTAARIYMPVVRRYMAGPCIYYGHDIQHRRLQAECALKSAHALLRWQAWAIGLVERRLWRQADVVLYPADEEAREVNAFRRACGLKPNAEMFPLWTIRVCPATSPAGRDGLLFVGSHAHAPNVDGLDWFLREVWPHLLRASIKCHLTIVGSGMQAYVPPQPDAGVCVLGQVNEATLNACYAQARVAIVPLRFGAGVKGKVLEAIGKGVPCVMTQVGAQGLSGLEKCLPVEDDPEGFAMAIMGLLVDDLAWCNTVQQAGNYVLERYDGDRFCRRLQQLLAG